MASVLAAPLMDVSRLTDTANLLTPTVSNSKLSPVNTPSNDAMTQAAAAGQWPRGPPTPLLIAVGPSKPLMTPDLRRLFSLYYPDPRATAVDQTKSAEPKLATAQ